MRIESCKTAVSRREAVRVGLAAAGWLALGSLLAACGNGAAAPVGSSPAASPSASSAAPSARPSPAASVQSSAAASVQASPAAQPVTNSALGAGTASGASCSGTVTPAETEGPYFKAGSPLKGSLMEPGVSGTLLMLSGSVFTKQCQPVPQALVDVWQADDSGQYDNAGYRLRGHVLSDQSGRYQIETIVPGLYPGRTRHIHVKVQAPSGPALTTQLYFPGEARNNSDGIFNKAMLLPITDGTNGKQATFNFVLNVA